MTDHVSPLLVSLEYPKIENLFARDISTHKLIIGEFRSPAFDQIKTWHVTEKIDGTNMRVVYCPDAQKVEIRGRSDRASIPGDLHNYMLDLFTLEKMSATFDQYMNREGYYGSCVTLFGEGYGPGIQKVGGGYSTGKEFRLFDVLYCWRDDVLPGFNSWSNQETVAMVSKMLQCKTAPILYDKATLGTVMEYLQSGPLNSRVAIENGMEQVMVPEGVVARSDPYLYTHRGNRVVFKLKVEDLA